MVELDHSEILIPAQAKDPRGERGFDPKMLTLLLGYAYCVGTVSSRKIERVFSEDLAFRVLTANLQPDHSRIIEFRRRKLDDLKALFIQILRLCQTVGMVSLGHVALDGTKVEAMLPSKKAMSHERMLKTERQLETEMRALLRKAEIIDAQEDGLYGKLKLGSDLPDELRRRQDRSGSHPSVPQGDGGRDSRCDGAAAAAEDNGKCHAESEAATRALAKEAQQAERRAKTARGRAELARRLAIGKAHAADLSTPGSVISVNLLAMPSRNLPTTAAADPKANAHRYITDLSVVSHQVRQRSSSTSRSRGERQPRAECFLRRL